MKSVDARPRAACNAPVMDHRNRSRYPAIGIALAAVWLGIVRPAPAAEDLRLRLPIDCHFGRSCWLVNLVDLDPGPGRRDYRCERHTYDGHKGVDIAVRDLAAMARGVPVVAAAPGIVKALRDGMPDGMPDKAFRETQQDRYCGNGVVIEHAGGWQTQYCHMRQGSVAVKRGDKVARGRKLGLVGHSGFTQFPHVHLSVRLDGRVIDPFLGRDTGARQAETACAAGAGALWMEGAARVLGQPMTNLFNAGFAAEKPKRQTISKGLYGAKALSRRSPLLVFWTETWWTRKGDRLEITITGPDGETVLAHTSTLERARALDMAFAGKRKPGLFWASGTYRGTARLLRDGAEADRFTISREILIRE